MVCRGDGGVYTYVWSAGDGGVYTYVWSAGDGGVYTYVWSAGDGGVYTYGASQNKVPVGIHTGSTTLTLRKALLSLVTFT